MNTKQKLKKKKKNLRLFSTLISIFNNQTNASFLSNKNPLETRNAHAIAIYKKMFTSPSLCNSTLESAFLRAACNSSRIHDDKEVKLHADAF